MMAVAAAVFGKGDRHSPGLGQRMGQPQRADARQLDLQQHPVVRQQGSAVISGAKFQLGGAPADVGIKSDAQFRVGNTRKSDAVVPDEHPGTCIVQLLEPCDLPAELSVVGKRSLPRQQAAPRRRVR